MPLFSHPKPFYGDLSRYIIYELQTVEIAIPAVFIAYLLYTTLLMKFDDIQYF